MLGGSPPEGPAVLLAAAPTRRHLELAIGVRGPGVHSPGAPPRPAETWSDRSAAPARSVPGSTAATETHSGDHPETVRVGARAAWQVQAVARYLLLLADAVGAAAARICVRISYMSMPQRISAAALCGRSSTRRWRSSDGPTRGARPGFSGDALEAARPGGFGPEGVGLCADPGDGGRRGPGHEGPLAPWRGARRRRPMMNTPLDEMAADEQMTPSTDNPSPTYSQLHELFVLFVRGAKACTPPLTLNNSFPPLHRCVRLGPHARTEELLQETAPQRPRRP